MCGLTGFYTAQKRPDGEAIGRAMNDSLRHRGPDGHGMWKNPEGTVLLAHRRLAIIDLSQEGAQPMVSASGRYVMTYNGEIYNYLDLKTDLERAGVTFRGRSDTEVFLAAVDRWGLNQSLQKINGMFAIVLWDAKTRTLHFIRDRFGKKPLYIGWAGKSLVFGSELKALRAHPDFTARVNPQALTLYMRYGYIPAPFSLYENIWSLPAGHRLAVAADSLAPGKNISHDMEPYWNPLRALEESKSRMRTEPDAAIAEEFETLLGRCVKDRMMSDVPLGAFLSGGIDSSAVVALMQKQSAQKVKTYTIGFQEDGFDEAGYAAKIAAHLGTDHHELYVDATAALDVVPHLPDMYDEPFADASAIPTLLVSKFARRDVTVALSGDGGDEVLGGYTRYIRGPQLWDRMRFLPRPARKILGQALASIPEERWDSLPAGPPQLGAAVRKAAAVLSLDSQDAMYKRFLIQNNDEVLAHPDYAETFLENPDWRARGLEFAETMMYQDTLSYLPNDILVKVDRASMAASLEARAPLLDRRLYDFAWSLPSRFKIRGRQGKWLLREVLKRHVPAALFERPKQGFNVPIGAWMRGPLKDWAEGLLAPQKIRESGLLDEKKIAQLWQAHKSGKGGNAGGLWTILMFQAWQDRWL